MEPCCYYPFYNFGGYSYNRFYNFPSNLNIHNYLFPSVLYKRNNILHDYFYYRLQTLPAVLNNAHYKLVILLPPFDHPAPYFHYKIYDGADYGHDDLAYGFERYNKDRKSTRLNSSHVANSYA